MKRQAMLLIAVFLLAATPIVAQMTGARLAGTVTDMTGSVITDATVTITNEATGISEKTDTGSTGTYIFRGLQPGVYDVKAEHHGFQTLETRGLKLMVGQDMGFDLQLKVGTTSEVVNVTAATPLVESQKAQIDTVITTEQLMNTPVSSRYFFDLVFITTPGVAGNVNTNLGEGLSVNGQRGFANQYFVDGMSDTNSTLQTVRGRINMDSIQEFQVLTHQFEAQYGNANGAVVNVATKGGTNSLHGTGYSFIQNAAFNGYSAFQKRMDYIYSQVNGTPVVLNKPDSHSTVIGGTIGGPIVKNKLFFFGSYEYSNEIDYHKIEAPQEFNQAVPEGPLSGVWSGRIDYTASEKDSFNFLYTGQRSDGIWGPGGYNTLSTEYREIFKPTNISATWNRAISSRTLSELRAQFSAYLDEGHSTQNLPYPYVEYHPHATIGKLPNVPFNVPEYNGQLVYNLSMTRGRHDIKVGGTYQRIVSDGSNVNFGDGEYDFAFDLPFDSTDDPLAFPYYAAYTYPWHYIRRIGDNAWNVPDSVVSWFAQDKWSITNKFVLTFGLRWDWENWFSGVDPSGTLTGKRASNPRANFGPRVSFAYSPFGAKTVLRGGFGRFYGRVPLNEAALIIQNTVNTRDQHWVEDMWGWTCGSQLHPYWPNPSAYPGGVCDQPVHVVSYPAPPTLNSFAWNNGSIDVLDNNLKYPYTDHWTLGIQHQFTNKLALNVDFVRIYGRNLWTMVDRNAPDPTSGPNFPRPDPNYFHITTQSSIGNSWFTDIEATLKYRASKGDFTVTYTQSKSIDDVRGDPNGWGTTCSYLVDQNPANLRCDRGLSANDLPYRLTFDGLYRLPYGFILSGTFDYHPGYPWQVYAGQDLNGDGWSNDYAPGYGRNTKRGDRYIWSQLRVGRTFKFGERIRWEPFLDMFNMTNTPSYVGYDGNILDQGHNNPLIDTYGKPTGSTGPRTLQFGCRFTF